MNFLISFFFFFSNHCGSYKGRVCFVHLMGRNIYYNFTEKIQFKERENFATKLSSLTKDTDETCRSAITKFVCHSLFPDCKHDKLSNPEPLAICKEDCLATTKFTCLSETIKDLRKAANTAFGKDSYMLSLLNQMKNCDNLPSYKDSEKCTPLNLFHIEKEKLTTNCYKDDGRYYNGTISKTVSGIECLPWNHDRPKSMRFHPEYLPLLNKNYCRNLGGTKKKPFCYPVKGTDFFEFCDIPLCESKDTVHNTATTYMFDKSLFVTITCASFVALILIIIIVILCYKFKNKKPRYSPTSSIELDNWNIKENKNYQQDSEKFYFNSNLKNLEYDRNEIIFKNDIGEGAFGQVFLATVVIEKDERKAAIKVLKEEVSYERRRDFEQEAELLATFDHKNIVELLGVCMNKKPFCLIMGYLRYGDLNSFLRKCDPDYSLETEEYLYDPLSDYQKVFIAAQIVDGMAYLASQDYVHRDLATRNCLVDTDLLTKIGDFGLTRKMKYGFGYQGTHDEAIPVRWQPLEAILQQCYTQKSDIWSFGIVLYEIFTDAKQPYMGKTHSEVIELLKMKEKLKPPDSMPKYIKKIMMNCLRDSPQERPTFYQLAEDFNQATQIAMGNIEVNNLNENLTERSPLNPKMGV